jgi:hypothetical protein
VQSGGKPPEPTPLCRTGEQAGFDQPNWSPDGNQVAWTEPDGIWIHRDAAGCTSQQPTLVLPGGSESDWGPADVNPGPRPAPQEPGKPDVTTDPPAPSLALTLPGKPRVSGRKVRMTISCPVACSDTATLALDKKTAKKLRIGRVIARAKAPPRVASRSR